jgi:hypothetical protein
MDFDNRLKDVVERSSALQNKSIGFKATLEEKTRQKGKIVASLAELGVKPEELDAAITATEERLGTLLSESEQTLAEAEKVFNDNEVKLTKLED